MNIKMIYTQNGKSLQEIMLQSIQQLVDTDVYLAHLNSTGSSLKLEHIQDERLHTQNKHIEMR